MEVSDNEINATLVRQGGSLRAHSSPSQEKMSKQRVRVAVFALFLFFTIAQVVLLLWKQRAPRSYNEATLLGLWIFPIILMAYLQQWGFCLLWFAYSFANAYYCWLANLRPLPASAPFRVYQWFDRIQKICYAASMISYTFLVLEILGIGRVLYSNSRETIVPFIMTVLALSLYFGVLGRDLATVCAERISSSLGYIKYDEAPSNLCALCGKELVPSKLYDALPESQGKVYKLDCGHEFHENCIRGWAIIGKKDTCPFCSEKVQVKKILGRSPWDASATWLRLLDMVRYLVVWNPVLLVIFRGLVGISGYFYEWYN